MILMFWWHFITHDIRPWTCVKYLYNEEHLKTLVNDIVNCKNICEND